MRPCRQALLTMLAVAAIAALNTSSAAAVEFHSEAESSKISGLNVGVGKYTMTAGEITCENASYEGTISGKTVNTMRLAGAISGCHFIIFGSTISATVNQNGCEGIGYANGEAEVVCPEGKNVVITAAGCTVTVPPQKNAGGSFTNVESHLLAKANATGVKYSHSGFTCGTGSGTNGVITAETTVKATDTGGNPVKLWVE